MPHCEFYYTERGGMSRLKTSTRGRGVEGRGRPDGLGGE